jgi:alkanesulfonate monooxygenase SsuD/methylene tetrahydromethanopterin reductase-like flavin-dependent oxidoreductase (luciferase family)
MAARYADEFNLSSTGPERAMERFAALDEVLRAAGRDPSTLARSAMVGTMIGRDAAEVGQRRDRLFEALGVERSSGSEWYEGRRARWILGTPDEARAMVRRFAEAGVERLMLQDFLPLDLDMVDLMGEALVGQV